MTTVYLDRVLVLNFLVDDLLLLCTARIAGAELRRLRIAFSAMLGAVYASAVFLPRMGWLSHPVLRLAVGCLIPLVAFAPHRRRFHLAALFLLLSAALGGFVLALGFAAGAPGQFITRVYRAQISWQLLIGTAAGFYVALHLLFRGGLRHRGGEIVQVTVHVEGKRVQVPTLWDTGNTLADPVNGSPVLVLEQDVLLALWPPEVRYILQRTAPAEEKMAALHAVCRGGDFCLLPYRSVGVSAGLLLAYRSEQITVERRVYRRTLLALSEGPLSDGGAYHALWGGERGTHREKTVVGDPMLDQPVEQTV